jgi:hypothetical protein
MTGGLENQIYQRIFTRALEDAEFAKGKWKSIIKLTSSIPIQDIEKRGVTRRKQHTSRGAAQNEESKDHILNLEESQQMETI